MLTKDKLLIHIEHSKPIEIRDFTLSLTGIGEAFSSFVKRYGYSEEICSAKLYVDKIEKGSIDIYMLAEIAAGAIAFVENANTLVDFAEHIKTLYRYLVKDSGESPTEDIQEYKAMHDIVSVTANDSESSMQIGTVSENGIVNMYKDCVFNYTVSNTIQNKANQKTKQLASIQEELSHKRVLLYFKQINRDSKTANRGIISNISDKPISVVFDSDELKRQILYIDENPIKKAFFVDVLLQMANGKIAAYKVMALHEIIELDS